MNTPAQPAASIPHSHAPTVPDSGRRVPRAGAWAGAGRWLAGLLLLAGLSLRAQTLLNVDFGAGATGGKAGPAATGLGTNDVWNPYRHYQPRFVPGMPPVPDGRMENLRLSDGTATRVAVAVTNAPGVWGNATGDAMLDTYLFASNGGNMGVVLTGLEPGRYHFFLYGWAAADVAPEQNSVFSLHCGTNHLGPAAASGAAGWQAGRPWQERAQHVVFRDVAVGAGEAVTIEVAPGAGGIAVLNGLQVLSRGTGAPRPAPVPALAAGQSYTNLLLREIRYAGKVDDSGAVFHVTLDAESRSTNELSAVLFEGEAAVLDPKLPEGWRILAAPGRFWLAASAPGAHRIEFELRPKVQQAEPWRQFSLTGPAAAIATVAASADRPDVDLQLVSGTPLVSDEVRTNRVQGVLGADRKLGLRWQGRTAEVAREAVLAADTRVSVELTPTSARLSTQVRVEVLQGRLTRLRLSLPEGQVLTRVEAEAMRDWKAEDVDGAKWVTVDFLRPAEGVVQVRLLTEQALGALPSEAVVGLPAVAGVQREAGQVQVRAEDVLARFEPGDGLRQVNAAAGEVAAFRFNARPARLRVGLTRVEPEVGVAARVTGRLEDTRFVVRHQLDVDVSRAGVYAMDLGLPAGLAVTAVKSEGLDDWKAEGGRLRLQFAQRVLGVRRVEVELEQPFTAIPAVLALQPMRVAGAVRETAFMGAAALPGLQVKTASATGARELPVGALPGRTDELLAFRADRADWRVELAANRMEARVVADVFNLVTVGDGVVGGSATLRFALVNQGVQQFRVRVPAHWRNVEFTGANIRRQDRVGDVWTLALQDKVWGAYTLVVTYDASFDARQGAVDASGAHAPDAERETGAVALTAAPGLTLVPGPLADPLRPMDPSELAEADRALISRPVLHAARYTGTNYAWAVQATRHDRIDVLDAVADRAQFTSVLTEAGEMLTSAGFMVKNSERQFQRFRLPPNASLWGVAVNGEPTKADRDGEFVVVALPRSEDRDRTFAIDLKYAQQLGRLGGWWPREVALQAPRSDVAGTYAEWQLYVPESRRIDGFDGSMTVAPGATYGIGDAWERFRDTYAGIWHEHGGLILFTALFAAVVLAAMAAGRLHGFGGLVRVMVVTAVLVVFAGMLLPALSKAKSKAQRIKSVNNLKNIGLAARIFSTDNNGRMPASLDEIAAELGSPALRVDPQTGVEYTWVGTGKDESNPSAILAYSPPHDGGREVLLADGSVQMVGETRFAEMLQEEVRDAMARGMSPVLAARYGLVQAPANQPADAGKKEDAERPMALAPAPQAAARPATAAGGMAGGAPTRPVAGPATGPGAAAPPAPPMVAGLRSLKIDVPRSGRALQFTRVLNLTNDAGVALAGGRPDIRFSVMSARAHAAFGSVLQAGAFLAGLLVAWVQWRRARASAFWLAAGLALSAAGVAALLVTWRALHLALIVGAPCIALVVALWLLVRFARWYRSMARTAAPPPAPPASAASTAVLLAAFLGLLGSPRAEAQAATNRVALVSATYEGAARERAAEFDAVLVLHSSGTNQAFALFGPEVSVRSFAATNGEAQLWRDGDRVGVLLPRPGAATVTLRFLARVGGDVARRRLEFDLPPALASRVGLAIAEADAEVEFPAAVSMARRGDGASTRVDAVLGVAPRLALSWAPRTRRAAETAVNAFGTQSTVVTVGGGVAAVRAVHDLQAVQGELRRVRVAIPAGQRLLRVTGDAVRGWDFADAGRQEVVAELVKPSTTARLVVETEQPLDALPAALELRLPRCADLRRESGTVAVRAGDELGLAAQGTAGLERIEPAEFAKGAGADPGALFSAWRFLQPDPRLSLRVEVLQPRLEATTRHQFVVGADQTSLSVSLGLEVKRAGIFGLSIPLPDGWSLDAVRGPALRAWHERTAGGRRVAEVEFRERTLGHVDLQAELVQVRSNLPPHLDLVGLSVPGLAREDGVVSVSTEPGVGVKTSAIRGVTEIPAGALGRAPAPGTTMLAFKFMRTGAGDAAPAWGIGLDTEQLASVVRAETVQFTTVSETLLTGRTVVRYAVENAPVQEFRLRVPATWRNVEISGAGIRRRDQSGTEWRVELQNKVRGEVVLTVGWDAPRTGATNALVVEGLSTVGTERETGVAALLASGQLQLSPAPAGDELQRVDTREVPAWARGPGQAVAAFRYARPGWRLPVDARRFSEATVLAALIEKVQLRTVVADHGESMTQLQMQVRNNGRQNLAVRLPSGATVWSAFVGGEPVRPAREGDAVLLPLESSGADTAVTVELTYVMAGMFPRGGGRLRFESPGFDAPLKDARWEMFLPPDYEYGDFGGSMQYDATALVPVAQDFTIAEYARQENAQASTAQTEAKDALWKARKEIAAGNYGYVERLTQNNRFKAVRDAETSRELKQLETEFNRVQSSNFINGQNAFANQNPLGFSDVLSPQSVPVQALNANADYDARVAEQQVAQLRRAQAVAVARVQPLRVTLPTRGVRHAFAQVLQTGTDKRLTVTLGAAGKRGMGPLKRSAVVVAGFGALWAVCALAAGRRSRRDAGRPA